MQARKLEEESTTALPRTEEEFRRLSRTSSTKMHAHNIYYCPFWSCISGSFSCSSMMHECKAGHNASKRFFPRIFIESEFFFLNLWLRLLYSPTTGRTLESPAKREHYTQSICTTFVSEQSIITNKSPYTFLIKSLIALTVGWWYVSYVCMYSCMYDGAG